jgi:long-subunit fatty acid transport protein
LGGIAWGVALGLLYSLTPRWKIGGVYREGPEFELSADGVAGPASPELPAGTRFADALTPWAFPDVFGLGVAYRSADGRWTGSFEWDRVEYSTILESIDQAFQEPGEILEDADELHLGGEYAFFLGRSVMAVRLGVWHDPDHQPYDERTPFSRAEVPRGNDELHLAAGFGVAFDRFQIDLGIDLSRLRDAASVSAIFSF